MLCIPLNIQGIPCTTYSKHLVVHLTDIYQYEYVSNTVTSCAEATHIRETKSFWSHINAHHQYRATENGHPGNFSQQCSNGLALVSLRKGIVILTNPLSQKYDNSYQLCLSEPVPRLHQFSDLSSLDYFLREHLKSLIYATHYKQLYATHHKRFFPK